MKVKWKMKKVSENFAKNFLDDIKIERIKSGIDKKLISDARITESLLQDMGLQDIKRRLIKMPRKEDIE